jgi:hypothetical protein
MPDLTPVSQPMMPSKLRFAKIADGVVKKARITEQQIIIQR